jgi:hypothetical protein
VNPRTLRALIPILREAREAGVLELEAGEGKSRIRLKLAPQAPEPGIAMEPGTDPGAADEDGEGDPRFFLEKHYAKLRGEAGS